ncbi:progestin and adipoQ receptor family member 3-like isoform X1 [Haliotis rubra]|uniref:progestin and adipoQ receptor family member 3-like isoform X1 n=1 Tax=Haliotis rubra TaxID=36100 RepID=UPI001EE5C258|nr:progestin and adipoQ receptor family member 3-like isoform X1 [Haliotis rubra]
MTMGRSSSDTVKNRLSSTSSHQKDAYSILDIEIDQGMPQTCSSGLCDISSKDIPLYKYNEIPDFLQGNPFVVEGYRVSLPFSLCLKSLFLWSNETINIWSHLLGFFIFLLLMLYDNIIVIPSYRGTLSDHIVVTVGLLCYQFCMLCSTGFHVFCCHSARASKRWLAVDLTGISVGIIGCYLPAVHYAFYCLSIWRDIYLIIITLLAVGTICVQLHPRYFSHAWFYPRMAIYFFLAAYGVIPTIHWVYLSGGLGTKVVQLFVPKVITMYVLGASAFCFFLSKFPERMFPGIFDFLGSSHQWWHCIVVCAYLWWHHSGQDIMLYRTTHECSV